VREEFGAAVEIDPSCFRPEQPCFTPIGDVRPVFFTGEPLAVDEWLATASPGGTEQPARSGALAEPERERLRAALRFIGGADDYPRWIEIGMALHAAASGGEDGFGLWAEWAAQSPKFDLQVSRRKWRSFHPGGGRGAGTLFFIARGNGWRDATEPTKEAAAWGDLAIPLALAVPEIPCSLLPGVAGEMAQALTEHAQTPPALALMLTLAAFATAAQRTWWVQPTEDTGYAEPLALWALVALDSGSRKTAVLEPLVAPVHEWESRERDRLRPEIAQRFAARALAEKRIERLKQDAAKAPPDRREQLVREIRDEKLAMPEELHAPRLVVGDVTPERAQGLLDQNGERLAIISDEAGILDVMAGAYGDRTVVDVFLKGHSASRLHVERQARAVHLAKPCITFGLALQPGVLATAAANRRFRDSGMLARFLFAIPRSTVGGRDVRRSRPIAAELRASYARSLQALLELGRGKERHLEFEADAREPWFAFAEAIEPRIAAGGDLEHVADWGGKLPGQVARVAALMQLADTGAESAAVGRRAVEQAVALMTRLIDHARAVFRLIGADDVEANALALLRWAAGEGRDEFTRREAQKALEGRFRVVDELKAAAARAAEWGALSEERQRRNVGARVTPYYAVHPGVGELFVGLSRKSRGKL
jgi:putative DNA primase/helicase